ncbi:LANO_0C00210g1_1 [Lachancea nothofagi CBS 11611]|uniref:LANO_0C00210g1_1 n=1 Tax=Lachancea nothofagi CBS 11611 TaxID=1266666 RepID=A0A1G4J396_9SACH|nr:LANO_0C00210g1_1 [Lachancea nothofagi CBS 11611]
MSQYGFIKVPRNIEVATANCKPPTPQQLTSLPTSPLARFILDYATEELPSRVFYHSLRVFQYSASIINDHFSNWNLDFEVLFITCLLHDIGTTKKNMLATKMSFEFFGGLISRDLILDRTGGDNDYADAVSEAIIRHQMLGETGFITSLGLVLQIATLVDNIGRSTHLVHVDTLNAINLKYPREGWSSCFAKVIDKENAEKPWGNTSALGVEHFRNDVLHNQFEYSKS